MKSPFEFLANHIYTVMYFNKIIDSATLSNAYEQHYGRDYYRVYVTYKFKDTAKRSYDKMMRGLDLGLQQTGHPVEEIVLTDDEKLYKKYLDWKGFGDDERYVSFWKQNYEHSTELIRFAEDLIGTIEKELKKFVTVKNEANTSVIFGMYEKKI
jgi:hypothetical protein